MGTPLTLMAVHAHPDDESSSTGGVLARCADEGIRTVVVTCTNGELGDAPGGIKPGEEGHDPAEVARIRLGELGRACDVLGVGHLELLGYHDSGMSDWEHKDRADVFCNVSVDDAAVRLSSLFEQYRPDVVVTYDEAGGYDHPDHVHAARVTMAAVERTGIPSKAYFTAFRRTVFEQFRAIIEEQGGDTSELGEPDPEQLRMMDAVEARITTSIDVAQVVDRKHRALATHASQIEESFWSRLPPEAFGTLFGEESFIRAHDTTGAPTPETDLFAGLRSIR
jgi:LmbE family N-acetylglucosaminyl deacetylase